MTITPQVKYTPLPDSRYPSRYRRFMVGYPYDEMEDYFHIVREEKRKGFVQRQAELYATAPICLRPWTHYCQEVVEQWREIDHPITLVNSALTYLHPSRLRKDIRAGLPIRVWCGGAFILNHPLVERVCLGSQLKTFAAYQISRALHDYNVHYKGMFSFSPHDELRGALATRYDFSPEAQRAQWTDDVAMGCYYAHFGKWPEIQEPIVVEPDWQGLMDYLNGREA